jgi:protein gp37
MSSTTTIEWTEATWNPVTGCTEVSPGCDHCYARTIAERFRGTSGHPYEQGFDLKLWPERMNLPFTWKKPRRVFVNSMSDLFHKDVPDDFIIHVFSTMILCRRHTYQVLTKRPSRLANTDILKLVMLAVEMLTGGTEWPAHIHIGTSIENQDYAWRADKLRQAQARIQEAIPLFISAEPLLGPLSLDLSGISWLIVGAESGHGARPMDDAWVRSLRDQATASRVAFFFKQRAQRGKKESLPELDGRVWAEYPVVLGGL